MKEQAATRCFQMQRDLAHPIPETAAPTGVTVRAWHMEAEEEQRRYLAACSAAFHDAWDLSALQRFLRSPLWQHGTTFTAFAGEEVAGSVLAYYDPDSNSNRKRIGRITHVFVLPPWRRRGVARYLLRASLVYLKLQGMAIAELEVVADNRQALSVYDALGFYLAQDQELQVTAAE